MNVEMVYSDKFSKAKRLITQGGDKVAEGIALLLIAKADYAADANASDGVNAADVLNKAIKLFQDNPYMAIGVTKGAEATEAEIKKSFRKYALKYHPDKTQNKTGLMFTVIQQAYATLSDPEKRSRHDDRAKRNEAKLEKMRKQKEEAEKRRQERAAAGGGAGGGGFSSGGGGGPSGGAKPPPSSTNSFRQPPQSQEEADYRAFNKRFYEEFRRKSSMRGKSPHKPKPPEGAPPSASASGDRSEAKSSADKSKGPAAPSKPRGLRATSRSDTTVTLEWKHGAGGQGDSTAYELQWRARGARLVEWETSTQLILGNTCRKKNLVASTCYEFRVRAASAWGWSGYGDPVMVVTNAAVSSSAAETTGQPHPPQPRKKPPPQQPQQPQPLSSSSSQNPPTKKAPPPRDLHKPPPDYASSAYAAAHAGTNWDCVVCRRTNGPDAAQCTVCYTKRSYRASKLHNIQQDGIPGARVYGGTPNKAPHASAKRRSERPRSDGVKAQTGYKREPGDGKEGDGGGGLARSSNNHGRASRNHNNNNNNNNNHKNDGGGGPSSPSRPQSARSRGSRDVPSTDRGYHSANAPSNTGGDDSDEEYGDEAWEFSETDVHDDDPFSEFPVSSGGGSSHNLQVGDTVLASGLTATQYNGLIGEVRSALTEGRYQVELKLKDGTKKDLRMKPANLRLKRRWAGADGGGGGGPRPPSGGGKKGAGGGNKQKHAFGTPEKPSNPKRQQQQQQQQQQGGGGGFGGRDVGGGDGYGFSSSRANMGYEGAGFPKIYWLNTAVTKLHNVRSEPIKESTIVGHLRENRQVLAMASAGDWLKVEWHSAYAPDPSKPKGPKTGAGWCLVGDARQRYLIEDVEGGVGAETGAVSSEADGVSGWESDYAQGMGAEGDFGMEDMEEVIYELRDESGDLYYFNGATGVSCWDPPEWIDSTDPVSGAVYYENTLSGETQWDKPWDFIPVVREEAYSTPEAQFIKSVLSPKRSRGPRNFYSPGEA